MKKRTLILAALFVSCGGTALRVGHRAVMPTTAPYRVTPRKLGDFQHAISSLDAAIAGRAATGQITLTPDQKLACDVTGNGSVSSLDSSLISQFAVGLIARFPVAERCGSDWIFIPTPAPVPGQTIVPPVVSSNSCSLGYIEYETLDPWGELEPPWGSTEISIERQNFRAILWGDCTGNWGQ